MSDPNDDIAARLAAIQAERADLHSIMQQRMELSPAEELEREERALAADRAMEQAQAKHGARAVRMVVTDAGAVIVRRPHIAAYRKFQDAEGVTSDQADELVKSCLLHPTRSEFDQLMRDAPGALTLITRVCVELAGQRLTDVRAK